MNYNELIYSAQFSEQLNRIEEKLQELIEINEALKDESH